MTIEKRAARVTLAVVGLAALVTACVPVTPPPPPPPPPPVLPSGCAPNAEPTAADPVDYVALVERAGDPRTDIVTFTASSDEQVEDKVAELEQQGDVVVVEPDQAVSVLVDSSNDPPLWPAVRPDERRLPGGMERRVRRHWGDDRRHRYGRGRLA